MPSLELLSCESYLIGTATKKLYGDTTETEVTCVKFCRRLTPIMLVTVNGEKDERGKLIKSFF